MNIGLITARGQQMGFKDNTLLPLLARPLLTYPYLAAKHAKGIKGIYLSTDGFETKKVGKNLGMEIIDRPPELSLPGIGHLEVIQHALKHIQTQHSDLEILVVMLGNVATHEVGIVDKCIAVLQENPHVDSCVTVSERNEFHPLRAKAASERKLTCSGYPNEHFLDIKTYLKIQGKVSTNRQDLEAVYFLNHAVWTLRPQNCFAAESWQWPGKFMGKTVVGIDTDHGIDIRDIEDVAFSERWLLNHGWTMNNSPYWANN